MMRTFEVFLRWARWVAAAVWLSLGAGSASAAKDDWPPLDPSEWTRETPALDPASGAEVLLKTSNIEAGAYGYVSRDEFRRLRVFDQRGVDALAVIRLREGTELGRLGRIEARTLKPDGRILALGKQDFFEQEVASARGAKIKRVAFSPRNLEPGDILEYRYSWRADWYSTLFVITFSEQWPVRRAMVDLEPPNRGAYMGQFLRSLSFNCPPFDLKPDGRGFLHIEVSDVPAYEEEPFSVPDIHNMASVLIYRSWTEGTTPEAFWTSLCNNLHEARDHIGARSRALRKKAEELTAGCSSDWERAAALFEFCRAEIVNVDLDTPAARLAREQWRDRDLPRDPTETLKQGRGTSVHINRLFLALMANAGLEAAFVRAGDRSFLLIDGSMMDEFAVKDLLVGANIDGRWIVSDPGAHYQPFGLPEARNTDTAVAIGSKVDPTLAFVDGSAAEQTKIRRQATLTLAADGSVAGEVTITLTGHAAAEWRRSIDALGPAERVDWLEEQLQENLSGAIVSDLRVAKERDVAQALELAFQLEVPNFAERTGTRLFFAPSLFRRGHPVRFTTAERKTGLMFDYRSVEIDEIDWSYPDGYTFEAPSAPPKVDTLGLGRHEVQLAASPARRYVGLQRIFTQREVLLDVKHYPAVKEVFTRLQESDDHVLVLKKSTD